MSNTLKFGNGQWATKKGSTLAYNDENGNFKPLPFNFERATSATRVNKEGLIEVVGNNEPRIDFKDNSKGALLLEPQRANLCTYSVNTTGSGWFAFDVTRIATNILSPDGSLTATRLESTGVNDSLTLFHSGNAGIDYTGSFFAKSVDGGGTIKIRVGDFGSTQDITLTNEWQRFSFTSKPTTTAVRFAVILDGLSSQVDVWGFQLEQGSYATSYIPTNGSTVTRVAESSVQTPPDGIIGQTEGTIYVEYPNIDNLFAFIGLSLGGSNNNNNRMIIYSNGDNILYAQFRQGGSITLSGGSSVINGKAKAALSFSSTESVFYVNGIQVAVGTATIWSGLSEVNLNQANQIGAKVKDLRVYNTRLSNAELQALTQV